MSNNSQPTSNSAPDTGHVTGKKPYVKPEIFTEDLYESKGLACTKINTGQPGSDCGVGSETS